MTGAPALVWFRQDLHLSDNPALGAALERKSPVIPVYIWAPEAEGAWAPGGASKWWLDGSLADLRAALEQRGSQLIIRLGPTEEALTSLAMETGASAVFWNRRYEPAAVARDGDVKSKPRARGIDAPERLPRPDAWPRSLDLAEPGPKPAVDWAAGVRDTLGWQWVAGCGADAAPYFHIFNPSIQAANFDPQEDYIRHWVPELEAGGSYPSPVVNRGEARDLALAALASIKRK